ncbi:hypothetical protein [Planctomycetes bacterium K23_9]|uniref:hypothetical protein n=1 Tax=Stieleria marina TaxID=1930275 RepID=UPI0011A61FA6
MSSLRDSAAIFNLDQLDAIDDAKELVKQRSDELIEYVNQNSADVNRDRWLDYLDLDPLLTLIADDESYAKIYRESIAVKHRLYGTAEGLELSRFRALRSAVDRLIPALKYSKKKAYAKLLSKKLNNDAEELEEMEPIPTLKQLTKATELLDLLSETKQTSGTKDVLRRNFGQPNVSIWVGEDVIRRVVSRPVNQTESVIDCILGTSINGKATLTGNVTADVFPMQGAVGLNVSMTGQVISRNRGYHKPVNLITSGYGDVTASRTLYISEAGISMEPTHAQAWLRTEINSINHRFRIVRRIARRKAAESKPIAERIAVEKLRRKVGESFADQVAQAGNVQIPDVMEKARPVLQRLDIPEPARMIGSTDNSVYLHSIVQRADQLAAPNAAPPIHQSYDAAIQIHETAINNTVGYLLAGRTITQQQIDQLLAQAGRAPQTSNQSVSESDDKDEADDDDEEEEEPFEIDFAQSRPIIFEARDGKVRLGISGTRFAQGKRVLKKAVEIAATYVPGTTADGAVLLVREGDVEIKFPGTKRLSVSQTATKRAIEKNFQNVFPETLLHQPIVLPQTIKAEALRGQVYRPRMIDSQDGWLTVALQ